MKRNLPLFAEATLIVFFCSFFANVLVSSVGCQSTAGQQSVITPARVQAVTALATYAAVIAQPDKRPAFSQASAALTSLAAQDKWDLPAAVGAFTASDILSLESAEGSITLAAVPLFADAFLPSVVDLRKSEYAKAFILGAKRGLELGLGVRPADGRRSRHLSDTGTQLLREAEATRPSRR